MNNKQRAENAEPRAMKAMALRIDGYSYKQIAEELGYATDSAACAAVRKIINSTKREMSEELKALETARLDEALVIAWEIARNPKSASLTKLAALDRVIKLQERRTKYYGLDQPDKHEHIVRSELDNEIERLMAELGHVIEENTARETAGQNAESRVGTDADQTTT
jgi:hypothetical protein